MVEIPDYKLIRKLQNDTMIIRNNIPLLSKIPPIFKKINSKKIDLPKDFSKTALTLEDAICNRRSWRRFSGSVNLKQISSLLLHSVGFRGFSDDFEFGITQLRSVPSAGSRHPIELYLLLQNVEGLDDGVYHYEVETHQLSLVSGKKLQSWQLRKIVGGQKEFVDANVILIMTTMFQRAVCKYGPRGFRLMYLDAGHIGQNVYLMTEALGLGACAMGGWGDEAEMEKLLQLNTDEELILYVMAIGKKLPDKANI